ncbi:MAG TPA: type II toxin-antitoxin system VapC family toxin [Cyclobacteriaceae bacterium]|nr:type II toxin-antitoxin system VapC family toxin [Cyclobacteriaceae bacterium]
MNGNRFLLDTNTVLYLLGGDQTLADFLFGRELHISVISEIELLGYGKLTAKERQTIKQFIEEAVVVELTAAVKHHAIEIREQHNTRLGDSIIAATARHTSLPFITADKGFNKVKGIDLVLYEK